MSFYRRFYRRNLTSALSISLVTMMAIAVALLVGAASASAAPVWRVVSVSDTTVAPGSQLTYHIQMDNIGNESTDFVTPINLTVTLPPGMIGVSADTTSFTDNGQIFDCPGAAGATVIFCTGTPFFGTGGNNNLTITVAVDPSAPESSILTTTFDLDGGGAPDAAHTVDPVMVTSVAPAFGIDAFDAAATKAGVPLTQAGGHPDALNTSIDFNTYTDPSPVVGDVRPVEDVKDLSVDLPPGLVGNPTGLSECTQTELAFGDAAPAPLCPVTSQVGLALVRHDRGTLNLLPVFNMVPPPGVPARFAFNAVGTIVVLDAHVRSGGDYGLGVTASSTPQGLAIVGSTVTLWGVPSDPSHDAERACSGQANPSSGGPSCPSGAPRKAFFRNPTSCSAAGDVRTTVSVDSWQHPGDFKSMTISAHEAPGYPFAPSDWGAPLGITGCDAVPFDPVLQAQPLAGSKAAAPSGFAFDLTIPQDDSPETPASQSDLRKVTVTLPQGVRVSPSSADGLGACSSSQIALSSDAMPTCPDNSKLGTVTIDTPLLDVPVTGNIFLAKPFDNPFDSLVAVYLVASAKGVVIKLPGQTTMNPDTGQITATFDDNPQLPFSSVHLEFKSGPRAALAMPNRCGTYTTSAELTGWNGKTVTSDSTFDISGDGQGGPCAAAQFNPTLHAGLTNPTAGSSSTFVLRVRRDDLDNEFKKISTAMPPGLLAKVAGVPLCSDAQAAAGNCPADSQIGRVEVGAGAGSNPFYITNGKVFLTEGYKGGPFGLAISVPAVAGPFDLGTVNVRAALQIDPLTSQVTVVSDPMPRILEGIPLQVRDVRVIVDRDGFMQSPTNCNEMSVGATIGSYSDDSATVLNRFQVGECGNLAFAPKISMGFTNRSQMHKRKKPGLDFRLSQKPGEANIKSVTVKLPRSVVLDVNGASGALCEVAQAENGSCPASSIVGHATAVTPLLDQPLTGAVYFVRGDNALPNIMVALRGAININLRSKSKVDKMGRLISTFATVPDAPIRQFHLTLGSAGRGVLSVAPDSDLCTGHNSKGKVSIAILGQNGKRESLAFKMRTPCKKSRKHKR